MGNNLPVKSKDEFVAEAEVMDLSPIKNHQFLVAVATGPEDSVKFLCSTVHGPYNFVEMLQEVGDMWKEHQHHARVVILDKDAKNKVKILDANTIDYIELRYVDLITEEMLEGAFDADVEFTCQAGFLSEEESSDPRHK